MTPLLTIIDCDPCTYRLANVTHGLTNRDPYTNWPWRPWPLYSPTMTPVLTKSDPRTKPRNPCTHKLIDYEYDACIQCDSIVPDHEPCTYLFWPLVFTNHGLLSMTPVRSGCSAISMLLPINTAIHKLLRLLTMSIASIPVAVNVSKTA